MPFLKNTFTLIGLLLSIFFSTAQSKSKPSEAKDSVRINYLSFTPESLSDSIVNFGKIFLNTPYRYGSPGVDSFDCSGFTSFVYRNFGYNLQRSSCDQAQQFDTVDRSQLKTGDLVFFSGRGGSGRVGHVGIVVKPKENGQFEFIHAAVHSGVTISNSEDPYYSRRFIKANRVVGSNPLLDYAYIPKSDHFNAPMPFAGKVQQTRKTVPAEYHKVKSGETLSSIAEKFDLTIAELKEMNGIKKNSISRNQKLKVKEEEKLMIVESAPKELASNEIADEEDGSASLSTTSTHTVKKGETLFSISKTYNVSVDQLLAFNNLKNNNVHSGQQLVIAQIATVKTEQGPKTIIYKVKKGESLFTISKDYNISTEDLKASNKLTNNGVQVGQELKIIQVPVVTPALAKVELAPKTITYMVKKGENLSSISKDYNLSVEDLKAINKLTTNSVQVGQVIKITLPPVKELVTANVDISPKTITYKVKKGESLLTIAKDYNITVEDLKAANKLSGKNVQVGQELKITPAVVLASAASKVENTPKTIIYKVKKGESLFTIAKDNNVSVEELKAANKLTANAVRVGQELKITQAAVVVSTTPKVDNAPKTITYKVKKGESLFTIAKDNNLSVDDLKAVNKLSSNSVQVGQELKIVQAAVPASVVPKADATSKTITYKVKKGESLFTIAKDNNMSVDELKTVNKLSSKSVQVGQELKIVQASVTASVAPKADATSKSITYKVRKGESLFTIAKDNNLSVEELKSANKLSSNSVQVGQELKLAQGSVVASVTAKTDNTPKPITYKVKKGESLFTIAKENNVSVEELKAANKLSSNSVKAGQEIVICQAAPLHNQTTNYTVKKGDNLSTIANAHNLSVDELKEMNQLTSKKLSVGQSLKVYSEQIEESKVSATKSSKRHKTTTHKVCKGESYFSIAHDNECSVEEIKSWNKKSKDQLNTGDKLVLFPKDI